MRQWSCDGPAACERQNALFFEDAVSDYCHSGRGFWSQHRVWSIRALRNAFVPWFCACSAFPAVCLVSSLIIFGLPVWDVGCHLGRAPLRHEVYLLITRE